MRDIAGAVAVLMVVFGALWAVGLLHPF